MIDDAVIHIGALNMITPEAVELRQGETIRPIPIERITRGIITRGEPVLLDVYSRVREHAMEEAKRIRHGVVGPEHLLLGLLHIENGEAGRILREKGVDLEKLRKAVQKANGMSIDTATSEHLPMTPLASVSFLLAVKEANAQNAGVLGTEHLILALLDDTEDPAARILASYDVSYENVREALRPPS